MSLTKIAGSGSASGSISQMDPRIRIRTKFHGSATLEYTDQYTGPLLIYIPDIFVTFIIL
jgi:hypothetical protein